LRAHNALPWRGMIALGDDAISWLDVGGAVFTLAGTFI
jgi:hypothetical protein